jgi:hypothetical protein
MVEQGRGAGGGGGRCEGNSFWPSAGSVYDGQQVGETIRQGQGAYQIDVDVGESVGRDRERRRRRLRVNGGLSPLAGYTLTGPRINLLSHAGPYETRGNQAAGGADARVAGGVKSVEDGTAKGGRNKWSKHWSGNVTKNVRITDQAAYYIKARGLPQLGDFRAGSLGGGEGGQIWNRGDEGLGSGEGRRGWGRSC